MQALDIETIKEDIETLRGILETEFEALKNQEITRFEQLQEPKNAILEKLVKSNIFEILGLQANQSAGYDSDSKSLDILNSSLKKCKDLQTRNEVLIRHKLIAIRETIESFAIPSNPLSDTYDKIGNISKSPTKRPRNF